MHEPPGCRTELGLGEEQASSSKRDGHGHGHGQGSGKPGRASRVALPFSQSPSPAAIQINPRPRQKKWQMAKSMINNNGLCADMPSMLLLLLLLLSTQPGTSAVGKEEGETRSPLLLHSSSLVLGPRAPPVPKSSKLSEHSVVEAVTGAWAWAWGGRDLGRGERYSVREIERVTALLLLHLACLTLHCLTLPRLASPCVAHPSAVDDGKQ